MKLLNGKSLPCASNYYWTATPSSATGCQHPGVDASISTWMPPGHLPGDSLRSTPGIHSWMRVRRRCGYSVRARPRDRSATARPFALDSTSHRPGSPARGLPRWQRRRVARRFGRRRSEAVVVANRIRRRGAPRFSAAHADEAVTVLREELLRALLARPEMRRRQDAP